MLKMFDFLCSACGKDFEDLADENDKPACKRCGSANTQRVMPRTIGRPFEVIKATTKTSGRYKAGSIHRFNRPASKIQSQVPRAAPVG